MEAVRAWYSKWNNVPWKHLNSPAEQWKTMPTFLIGEYAFIFLAALGLLHSIRQGRQHIFVWVMSFLAGSANDIFFMYLPLVDNFWQAQATIMLTPRLPLYICCVYSVFMYYSTITAWRLGLPVLSEACISGLMGIMIYMPYDIVGIKHLWWTWHDTDPPIAYRLLGVPVGSTLWVITFTGTFAFLIRKLYLDWKCSELLAGLGVCLLSTPLMMVQMALLQLVSWDKQGEPTLCSLMVGTGLYVAAIMRQIEIRNLYTHPMGRLVRRGKDAAINVALCSYYIMLIVITAVAKPEQHISTGLHQTYGPCGVEQVDFSGQVRHQYVCAKDVDEDWDFSCAKPPPDYTDWYTVCGRAHTSRPKWLTAVSVYGLIAITVYSLILRFGTARVRLQTKKEK